MTALVSAAKPSIDQANRVKQLKEKLSLVSKDRSSPAVLRLNSKKKPKQLRVATPSQVNNKD